MVKRAERFYGRKPTGLFRVYVARLVFRVCLFAAVLYVFVTEPEALQFSERFGFAHGFDFIDFVFLALLADIASKFFPNAKVAMGSRKQFRRFHLPTARLFEGGAAGLWDYVRQVVEQGRLAAKELPETLARLLDEVRDGMRDGVSQAGRRLVRALYLEHLLPFSDQQLSANEELRASIRKRRRAEVVPVAVFWVLFNGACFALFWGLGILTEPLLVLWTMFYALVDMVSVVLWCPLQLVLMKNRCCTTCQIFNWDAIMTVTPLLAAPAPFSLVLVGLALAVLVRWEAAFVRHPERFDERTNASLSCACCTDRLCYLRDPLADAFCDDEPVPTQQHRGQAG